MFLMLVVDIIWVMKVFTSEQNVIFCGLGLEQIRDSFPYNIDGYKFECVSISEFEMDDDRTWSESVGFTVYKDGKNVLNNK